MNDGSTDNTPKICDELKEKYKNIIVIHKENQGTAKARETGFNASTGEYITFIDSDDYIDLTAYEKAIKILEENNCDIVQFGIYAVDINGKIIDKQIPAQLTTSNKQETFLYFFSLPGALWDKIYKRSSFLNLKWLKLTLYEDEHILMQALANAKKLMTIETAFYYAVKNPDSVTHRPYSHKFKEEGMKSSNFIIEFTEKNFPEFLPEALWRGLNTVRNILINHSYTNYTDKQKDIKQIAQILNEYYKRFFSEIEKQKINIKARPQFSYLKHNYIFKIRFLNWLFARFPKFAIFAFKTRVKIKNLTGI